MQDDLGDPPRNTRYVSLDIWRGVACLAVVGFHATFYASHANGKFGPANPLISLCSRLWIGVPVFFVISGYCIAATADSARRRGSPPREFFLRRFRRIFPPYLAALAIAVAMVAGGEYLRPGLFADGVHTVYPPSAYGPWQWLGNLTLTEGWREYVVGPPRHPDSTFMLGQAWTLGYEEQFYAIVGIVLVVARRRLFLALAVVTAGAIALEWRWGGLWYGPFFAQAGWLQFAAGIAVYCATNYGSKRVRLSVLAALLAAAALCLRDPRVWRLLTTRNTFAFVAFAFAAVALLLRPADAWVTSRAWVRPLTFCGTICYSLYLVHWPLCKAISHLLHDAGVRSATATLLVTVPVCLAASIAAGWAFHVAVERRFLNAPRAAVRRPAVETPGRVREGELVAS